MLFYLLEKMVSSMKNKIQKINTILIKMMTGSLIAQIFILGFLIIFVRNYMHQSQTNMISDDLLIKDTYTIDKIGQYKILDSKYALDLELHNIGDMRKLDSIKFISSLNKKIQFINCDILNTKQFKLCKSKNGTYLGVSIVSFNNNTLGYIVSEKKYALAFPVPGRYDLFLILFSVIGIFIINFGFLFLPLKKKIEKNTKQLLNFISSQDISNTELSQLNIEEYKKIAIAFIGKRNEISKLQQEKSYYYARKNIAEQVAHDIRSPLTAINMAFSDIASIPESKRVMIKNACTRINDIANNLLSQYVNNVDRQKNLINNIVSPEMIYFAIENIVSEKNYEYSNKKCNISLDSPNEAYFCFSKVNLAIFKRIISNLINNSIEAIGSNGVVKIEINCDAEFIEITITDNGCGIPNNILPKITEEGFSFGKKTGAGFGLFHAKHYIENINGSLTIKSEVGEGTTVTIALLQTNTPEWFCETLKIRHDYNIVILDDDPSIHDAWNQHFLKFFDIKIAHFSTASDLIEQTNLKADLYLVDYELLADQKNGLDVINDLNINHCSLLVTSCFEDSMVRNRCKSLGIKIIPKPYVPYIPIFLSTTDIDNKKIVFIDDDALMRMTWVFAADQAGVVLDVYKHPKEFISKMKEYNKNTVIYIDSDFGEETLGETYAKKCYDFGFKDIHLATGHAKEKFSYLTWIKSVVDKTPPF